MTPLCTSCFSEGFQAVLQKKRRQKTINKKADHFSAKFNKLLFKRALSYSIGIECIHVGDHTILCRRRTVATLTGGI